MQFPVEPDQPAAQECRRQPRQGGGDAQIGPGEAERCSNIVHILKTGRTSQCSRAAERTAP